MNGQMVRNTVFGGTCLSRRIPVLGEEGNFFVTTKGFRHISCRSAAVFRRAKETDDDEKNGGVQGSVLHY